MVMVMCNQHADTCMKKINRKLNHIKDPCMATRLLKTFFKQGNDSYACEIPGGVLMNNLMN